MQRKKAHLLRRATAISAVSLLLVAALAGCGGGGRAATTPSTGGPGLTPGAAPPVTPSTSYTGSGAPTGKSRSQIMKDEMRSVYGQRGQQKSQ